MILSLLMLMAAVLNPFLSIANPEAVALATVAFQVHSGGFNIENNITKGGEESPPLSKTFLEDVKPNEGGEIIVLMYHNLVENGEDEGLYARSFENFEKDVRRLIEEDYAFITMKEWTSGTFDVPAGKTPAILTFDDGHFTDIQLDDAGNPSPKSVIGILEGLKNEYPGFVPKATFYLNGPHAFGDAEYDEAKINFLLERGYEIGNHTSSHINISNSSREEAREEILSQARRLEKYTGSKEFSFSVPFGEKFEGFEEAVSGDWLGEYRMTSSVNVGWCPSSSVYSKSFTPYDISRITCGDDEYEMSFWLDNLKENHSKRFISDGNPNTVTIPEEKLETINKDLLKEKNKKLMVYDEDYNVRQFEL